MLTAALGAGWLVFPYAKSFNQLNPGVGVIVVSRSKVAPAGSGLRTNTMEVHVIEPTTDPATAEDALEARLDAVLDAFDTSDFQALVGDADRAMYPVGDSSNHSYVVNLSVLTRK